MAMTKDLPFWMFMKPIIFEITENGVLFQLQQKWALKKQNCAPLHRKGEPLSVQKLSSLFLFCLFGIILTMVTLFIEIMYGHKNNISTQLYPPVVTAKIILKNDLQELGKRNMGNQVLHSLIQDIQQKFNI